MTASTAIRFEMLQVNSQQLFTHSLVQFGTCYVNSRLPIIEGHQSHGTITKPGETSAICYFLINSANIMTLIYINLKSIIFDIFIIALIIIIIITTPTLTHTYVHTHARTHAHAHAHTHTLMHTNTALHI